MHPMIFVSIASYRDPELLATVEDCLGRAAHPAGLHVAVLEQSPQATPIPDALVARAGRFSYLHLDHRYSRGPCWARSMIGTYLREEPFFLQIDAHMRFDDGWDRTLLQAMQSLPSDNPRAIISSYPCAFALEQGRAIKQPMPGHALVLRPVPGAVLAPESPVLSFHAIPTRSAQPLRGHHVGAGCLFARSSLLAEVPIDPWLYFHGEEQNLAVRAWTHGWDIWHPPDLPVYHLYGRQEARPVHWEESEDRDRPVRWWQLHQQAEQRMAALLFEQADLGVYGLGQARSLGHYAASSGIDYPRRTLQATP